MRVNLLNFHKLLPKVLLFLGKSDRRAIHFNTKVKIEDSRTMTVKSY